MYQTFIIRSLVHIKSLKLRNHIFKGTHSSLMESVILKSNISCLPQQSCLFCPEQINCCSWNQTGLDRFSLECLAASSCCALGASMGKHFDLWLIIVSALSFLLMMETRQTSLDWSQRACEQVG